MSRTTLKTKRKPRYHPGHSRFAHFPIWRKADILHHGLLGVTSAHRGRSGCFQLAAHFVVAAAMDPSERLFICTNAGQQTAHLVAGEPADTVPGPAGSSPNAHRSPRSSASCLASTHTQFFALLPPQALPGWTRSSQRAVRVNASRPSSSHVAVCANSLRAFIGENYIIISHDFARSSPGLFQGPSAKALFRQGGVRVATTKWMLMT